MGALGGHAAAGVAAIGTGAHALGTGAVTGVATGVKTVTGEGVKLGEAERSCTGTPSCERWLGPRCAAGCRGAREEDDLLSDMRDVLAEEGVALLVSTG